MTLTAQSPKKIYLWSTEVKAVYKWTVKVRPEWGWWTYAKYTFDDQNSSQITDNSWNGKNLTWNTMPSYVLVSGSNYAWNYANVSWNSAPYNSGFSSLWDEFTVLVWAKFTSTWQQYLMYIGNNNWYPRQHSEIIFDYKSNIIEYYDYTFSSGTENTIRTNILTWVSTWVRHLVGYTRNWTAIQTYADGTAWNSITWHTIINTTYCVLWSSMWWNRLKWQIWEAIVENKVWTATEISNYYNTTKWNYWIS